MRYFTEPLNSLHKKQEFHCRKILLDNYLHKQAKQDVKRKLAVCFILADEANNVQGYYTLSNLGLDRNIVPEEIKRKMPQSYKHLPVTLLGRLAIDENFHGQGLGKLLLLEALKRSYQVASTFIGSMAVIVDPIDEAAISFYKKWGFTTLSDSEKMFLPMKTIEKLFKPINSQTYTLLLLSTKRKQDSSDLAQNIS